MVKVGLVTWASIPSPRASPLTNSVFPEPRSPIRLKTVAAGVFLIISEPISRVSSGLLEMRCIRASVIRNDHSLCSKNESCHFRQVCQSRLSANSGTPSATPSPIAFSPLQEEQKAVRSPLRLAVHFRGWLPGEEEGPPGPPQTRGD